MLPCSSIWRIFGSFDLMAESSFATWSKANAKDDLQALIFRLVHHHHSHHWVDLHLYVLNGHFNWCQDDLFLVSHLKTFHEGQMPEKKTKKPESWFWCMGSGWRWSEWFFSCTAPPVHREATVRWFHQVFVFLPLGFGQIWNSGANKRRKLDTWLTPSTVNGVE